MAGDPAAATMFLSAVLCPDHAAFAAWCYSRGFRLAGDGAESANGRWLALRVLQHTDLKGVTSLDRVEYAVDFWRRGTRQQTEALDALARSRLRRAPRTQQSALPPSPRGAP